MKQRLAIIALSAAIGATPALAQAGCIAQYKAKRDNPLALFFDAAQITGPCTKANAQTQLRRKLERQGLTLLKIVSVRES